MCINQLLFTLKFLESMKKRILHIYSFSTRNWIFLSFVIIGFLFSQKVSANGGYGNFGVIMQKNGASKTPYIVNSGFNNDGFCSWYTLTSAQTFNNNSFGHVSALVLNGLVIDGWTDNTDFVSGQVDYRIWLSSGSRPSSVTGTFTVGGYGSACSFQDVQCSLSNNKRVGWDGSSIDLLSGFTPGNYTFEIISHNQLRYNCGSWNQVDNAAVTATFTVDPIVTFNSNSGSGTMANETVSYNTSTALTANSFTRTGYAFNGWNTAANGSGTSYSNNASVTLTSNTTLYAQWLAVPTITSIGSSLPAFSSTQTYKGATITVKGTNLSAITTINLGGVSGTSITTSSPTQIGNATSLNFVVPDGTSGGTIYVSDGVNSATSSGTLTNLGFISTNSSNWSVGSTWLGGTVPTATDNVSIAHGTSVMLDGDKTVANFTINSTTGNFSNSTYTLTIAANGTLTNNNSGNGFTRNSGTVSFAGTGTIVGTIGFNNVTIAGGVNFGSTSTINGTLTINAGGYVNTNAPTYASGSTLKYNTASTYGRGTEWSTTTGGGYPYNVQISNNSTLDMGANGGTGAARQCAGNLTVDAGSTFSMNATAMSAAVTVMGNVVNNGTITLSGTSGGDLKTQGNINDSGTFNANNRAIFFNGGNTQVIQGTGTFDISYVRINKTGGSVQLATDLTCAGPSGGNAMEIDGTSSVLDLNGHTLYLGQASVASTYNSGIATPGSIKGSSTSSISILGTGALGTLSFTSGSQTLNNLTIDRQTSGSVILGTALTLSGQLTLTNGTFTNSTNLTLGNGATVVRSAGTLSAAPTFGSTVNLTYTGSATKGNEFPSTDIINTLTVNNTGGIALADNRNIPNLSIGSGSSLSVNAGKQLTVSTSMSNSGTLNLLSTNTDGTATILTPSSITNSSATYHVYQYIGGARNWYVSSPVSAATASSNYTYYVRNEGANSWPVVSTGSALAVGTGYIANLSAGTSTIDFTGGILNNGDKTVTLTRNTGVTKEGFNLVGNPYPSHITLSKTITDAANSLNTIWYRTASWDGSKYVYAFSTCLMNQDGTYMSTPYGTSTNIVSPMQAFWVRANSGGGTLTFANTMRSHQSSNPLKAPANINVTQQVLRLQVTNNNAISDETILYFNSNASNEFDSYDAPKMANASVGVPELYTLATSSTEQLAINGLNSIPLDTEIPLGFTTGETNTFTIKASEFSNFDAGTTLILKDYHDINNPVIADLSDGSSYLFSSDITSNNTSRFALIFKSPSSVTGINGNSNPNLWISVNSANQVVVTGNSGESSVAIYTPIGQKLYSKNLTSANTTLNTPLQAGVYMVTVTNAGKSITKKITIS